MVEILKQPELYLFYLAGIAGMLTHWSKLWIRNETDAGLWEYLFVAHPRYTLYAFLTYTGAVATMVFGGDIDFTTREAFLLAVSTGYSVDSAVNKDLASGKQHEAVIDEFDS